MEVQLGISGIHWANEDPGLFENLHTCESMLTDMAALGFEGTEMSRLFARDPAILKPVLDAKRLRLASGWHSTLFSDGSRLEAEMAGFRKHADFLNAMGCRHVIACEIRDRFMDANKSQVVPLSEHEWTHLVEGLHEAGKYCRTLGMELVYHFHGQTVIETPDEVWKLTKLSDPELVHLLFDTGHVLYGGGNPLALLRSCRDRVRYVHLKDVRQAVLDRVRSERMNFSEAVAAGVFTVPGDGCIDFGPLLRELRDVGYRGWLVIEAEQNPAVADPYEYALRSKSYIESLLGRGSSRED